MRFRNVSGSTRDLAGGAMLATGAYIELDAKAVKEPHNATLIADGALIEAPVPETSKKEKKS